MGFILPALHWSSAGTALLNMSVLLGATLASLLPTKAELPAGDFEIRQRQESVRLRPQVVSLLKLSFVTLFQTLAPGPQHLASFPVEPRGISFTLASLHTMDQEDGIV